MTSDELPISENSANNIITYPIPKNWEKVSIKDIAEIKGGKRLPSGHILSNEKTPNPYIRVVDFKNMGIDTRNLKYLSLNTYNHIKRYTISSKDVYVSIAGTIGLVGLIPPEVDGANLTENAAKLTGLKNVDNIFLAYSLSSSVSQKQISNLTGTGAQPKLALFRLESIELLLPPLPEQHKIASILSKVDEHISHTEAIIEKTEELKKGLMQQLLTKGIGHTKFKKTEIGEIPEEWDVRSLPHVFNVIDYRGRTPPFSDNGIPYIGADNIKNESIVFSNRRYVSDETYEQYMTRGIPNPGDILFTTEAPLGKVAQAPNYKFCLAQRLVAFQCKNDYDPTFFMYILKSDVVQKQFLDWSTGTTVKGISAKNMKFIKLSCPRDVTEQKRIGRILSQVDDQLTQNQTYLSHLQELKKGLMQDLLTGKVRVKIGTNH